MVINVITASNMLVTDGLSFGSSDGFTSLFCLQERKAVIIYCSCLSCAKIFGVEFFQIRSVMHVP